MELASHIQRCGELPSQALNIPLKPRGRLSRPRQEARMKSEAARGEELLM